MILVLVALLGCGEAGRRQAPSRTQAYYLPFSIETFKPVTDASIESDARCVIALDKDATEALSSMIMVPSGQGGFDHKRVRLKVVDPATSAILIDADGGVLKGDRSLGAVPETSLHSIGAWLAARAEAQGCDPSKPHAH